MVRGIPNIGEVLFSHNFHPIGELHSSTPTLIQYPVFMRRIEDDRMTSFMSTRVKYFVHHFELNVVQ